MKKALIVIGTEYEVMFKGTKLYRERPRSANPTHCKVVSINADNTVTVEVLEAVRRGGQKGEKGDVSLGQVIRTWADKLADDQAHLDAIEAKRSEEHDREVAVAAAFNEQWGEWVANANTKLGPYGVQINGHYRFVFGDAGEADAEYVDPKGADRAAEFDVWLDRGLIMWMSTRIEAAIASDPTGDNDELLRISDLMMDKLGWSGMARRFRDAYLRHQFPHLGSGEVLRFSGQAQVEAWANVILPAVERSHGDLIEFYERSDS